MKKLSILVFIFTMATAAWAVPARKTGIVVTQPDGSEVTVYQHGDEHFHWQTNEKGEWIELDENGFYRVTEALSVEQIEAKRMASSKRAALAAYPLNVAPRGLVILVNFSDVAFETEKAEMDSMLIGENYTRNYSYSYKGKTYSVNSKGSARQYFQDASNGQYNPQFDVIGPVTISNNVSYYGKNDSYGNDMYADKMVSEACKLADTEFDVDFTQYDNDNDGYVDFVFVIYAGYGEADGGASTTIWPHSWNLLSAGTQCKVDGKTVDLYACGNELDFYSKKHTGIGTFCHEFSHVLGLPDLYVTNTSSHTTMNEWDIMDYGPYNNEGNTPPSFSAYERFFMGWLQPRLITEPENIQLNDLQTNNEALLISTTDEHNLIGNNPDPTTFYIVENRQQKNWDEHLPGHGMMLTKIQYSYSRWSQNTVNNSSSKMGVDLIEANGKTSNQGKATDLFPAGASQYLAIADHAIEAIEEENGVIKFKYKGGVEGEDDNEGNENEGNEGEGNEDEESALDNINSNKEIIAIYNILGQKQFTTNIADLTQGTYIIVTATGNQKIVR
jgi:M6 family metalloprotease-like protein